MNNEERSFPPVVPKALPFIPSRLQMLIVVVVFGILSLLDYAVYSFSPPSLEVLQVAEGKVLVSRPEKNGRQFNLDINGHLTKFNCRVNTRANKECLSNSQYNGLPAKVWWYEGYVFGPIKQKILFQLEINNQKVLAYEVQKSKYLQEKASYPYIAFSFLIISIIVFCLLRFSDKNIKKGF